METYKGIGSILSPAVRKIIADNKIDPFKIEGTGKNNRITKTDVLNFLKNSDLGINKEGKVKENYIYTASSPKTRYFARSLGINIDDVLGSARKGRVLEQDIRNHVKQIASGLRKSTKEETVNKEVDFSEFGEVEEQKLNSIKVATGKRVKDSWNTIPHVTHYDECDVTELEEYRKIINKKRSKNYPKLTMLPFIISSLCKVLKKFPSFNSSLSSSGKSIILKKYFNIGVAMNASRGLFVPVIFDTDKKDIIEIAKELDNLKIEVEEQKVKREIMRGGSFTISNIGSIGGGHFTPIINFPEVAILGIGRAKINQVWKDERFSPRLLLPLSLSYDHRVIDGAAATEFLKFLCNDIKNTQEDYSFVTKKELPPALQ